jgi:thiamine-phosphate pyrophosphorylase
MRGLYAILDTQSLGRRGLDLVEFARAVLSARPPVLQLRAKDLGARDTLELLRALAEPCREAGCALFANDRPDLAVLGGCAGVHMGQGDLDVADVRAFSPGLRVGVSTHDAGELERALDARPDYVAFGPVFPTRSKERLEPVVGLDGLRRAAEQSRARGVPLVAIGGIDHDSASAVAEHAELGAVIAALLPSSGAGLDDVRERARVLQLALSRSP